MFSTYFMHVLVTCKNACESVKNEGARVVTCFLIMYKSIGIFQTLKGSLLLSLIWPNFELARDDLKLLVICKLKKMVEFGLSAAEIFMFESVYRRTDRRQLDSHPISLPPCELLKRRTCSLHNCSLILHFLRYCIDHSSNHKWFSFHE